MYCYKCGKYVETDDTLCPDCKQKQAQEQAELKVVVTEQTATTAVQPNGPSNKAGIVGLVMSMVSITLTIIAVVCAAVGIGLAEEAYADYEAAYGVAALAIVLQLAATAFIVLAIVYGVKGIKNFKLACRLGTKKPLPGFIMGIAGLSATLISAIYGLYSFILAGAIFAM